MKLFKISLACFVIGVVFNSCQEECEPNNPPANILPKLLRAIEFDNGIRSDYFYNPDSTLCEVRSTNGTQTGRVLFNWTAGQMRESHIETSLYKNVHHYNGDRYTAMENLPKQPGTGGSYRLDFTYRPDGKVDSLYYSRDNGAGPVLQASSGYNYHPNGTLSNIRSEQNGNVFTYTIESYSPECDYNVWTFVGTSVGEEYMIYNYPVMKQLGSLLPGKIVVTRQQGTGPLTLTRAINIQYWIQNRLVEKTHTIISVPQFPDNTSTANFYY